jgi:hypothetical protein
MGRRDCDEERVTGDRHLSKYRHYLERVPIFGQGEALRASCRFKWRQPWVRQLRQRNFSAFAVVSVINGQGLMLAVLEEAMACFQRNVFPRIIPVARLLPLHPEGTKGYRETHA